MTAPVVFFTLAAVFFGWTAWNVRTAARYWRIKDHFESITDLGAHADLIAWWDKRQERPAWRRRVFP